MFASTTFAPPNSAPPALGRFDRLGGEPQRHGDTRRTDQEPPSSASRSEDLVRRAATRHPSPPGRGGLFTRWYSRRSGALRRRRSREVTFTVRRKASRWIMRICGSSTDVFCGRKSMAASALAGRSRATRRARRRSTGRGDDIVEVHDPDRPASKPSIHTAAVRGVHAPGDAPERAISAGRSSPAAWTARARSRYVGKVMSAGR